MDKKTREQIRQRFMQRYKKNPRTTMLRLVWTLALSLSTDKVGELFMCAARLHGGIIDP